MVPLQAPAALSTAVWERTACDLAADLKVGRLDASAVLEAHLARIAAIEPTLQAFVTVDADGARAQADRLDSLPPAARGPLHGLPVAVKDLTDTAGLRTTYGSSLFADHVPAADDLVVARLRAAGAVVVGKTNTPEFGFGAVCVNPLRGPTRNPHAPALTSGGSSGGSAVAVATGMASLAQGTDFGGSVRTPAGLVGCVSLRPTPGLVPAPSRSLGWDRLASHGVMARTVADCALMLDAIAGPDPRDPTSMVQRIPWDGRPPRLAATADFGGVAPVADAVVARFAEAVEAVRASGRAVSEASPDCTGAVSAFRTLRAAHIAHGHGALAERFPGRLTETVAWNIAAADGMTARDYLAAEARRTQIYRAFSAFFAGCDVLLAPAAAVMAWPHEAGEVTSIDGRPLSSIVDYLAVTFIVSLVGFPVLTLPVPQGPHRLPFGVQLVGRPGEEALLLALGRELEAVGFAHRFPPELS